MLHILMHVLRVSSALTHFAMHTSIQTQTCSMLQSRKCVCHGCRYFDPETVGLDFEGMCSDIKAAPEGSIIVLHGNSIILHGAYSD